MWLFRCKSCEDQALKIDNLTAQVRELQLYRNDLVNEIDNQSKCMDEIKGENNALKASKSTILSEKKKLQAKLNRIKKELSI